MTTWKLQKLVYYSQAWSLVWDDDALFPEKIEAWANGPVVRKLYDAHRRVYRMSCLMKGNPDALTRDQRETVDSVLRFYGDKSPQVAERSHPHGRSLAIGTPGGSRRRARQYHHSEAGSGRILRQPVTAVVRRPGKRPGARAFPPAGAGVVRGGAQPLRAGGGAGAKSPAFGRAWPIERIRSSLHDTSSSPRTDRLGFFRLFSRWVISPILPTRHSRNQTPVGRTNPHRFVDDLTDMGLTNLPR